MDQLAREFERGVRYYNEPSNKDFPFVRILGTDDVELPTENWVWVIGYYPASDAHPTLKARQLSSRVPEMTTPGLRAILESHRLPVPYGI